LYSFCSFSYLLLLILSFFLITSILLKLRDHYLSSKCLHVELLKLRLCIPS
jgi:hypothetical protein